MQISSTSETGLGAKRRAWELACNIGVAWKVVDNELAAVASLNTPHSPSFLSPSHLNVTESEHSLAHQAAKEGRVT